MHELQCRRQEENHTVQKYHKILEMACSASAPYESEEPALKAIALLGDDYSIDGDAIVSYMISCVEKRYNRTLTALKEFALSRKTRFPEAERDGFIRLRAACVNSNDPSMYSTAVELATGCGCDASEFAAQDMEEACRGDRNCVAFMILRSNSFTEEFLSDMALISAESGNWVLSNDLLGRASKARNSEATDRG